MNQLETSEANETNFTDLRPYDVLCGRNRNAYNNIGNRRFRITVSMNLEKYEQLGTRHERSKFIANLAVTLRREAGFRFIKRKDNCLEELTTDEVRAKVGHALRDLSATLHGGAVSPEKVKSSDMKTLIPIEDSDMKPSPKTRKNAREEDSKTKALEENRGKKPRNRLEEPPEEALDLFKLNLDDACHGLLDPFSSSFGPKAHPSAGNDMSASVLHAAQSDGSAAFGPGAFDDVFR